MQIAALQRAHARDVVALQKLDRVVGILFRCEVEDRVQPKTTDERKVDVDGEAGTVQSASYQGEVHGRDKDSEREGSGRRRHLRG